MKFRFMMVEMQTSEWDKLSAELIAEYGKSILLSWRMRRELGCVYRYHYVYTGAWPRNRVFLDFFTEEDYTAFILRYS